MKTPIDEYLEAMLEEGRSVNGGQRADYIPALAEVDPELFAIAVTPFEGRTYSAGDDEHEFTIQSMSKPFAYAQALEHLGVEVVSERVSVEPSGESFNELSLEKGTNRPMNPMINAGAMVVHQMIRGDEADAKERALTAVRFQSALAGRDLEIDWDVFESEMVAPDRNMALAHMLRGHGILHDSPHDVVAGYTAQCSTKVTVKDLAMMGATLANGGIQPVTGQRVMKPKVARWTLAVMASNGFYDYSGRWMADVGVPAKSGVSGGIVGALPGRLGISVYSPRLDTHGSSVRGMALLREVAEDMDLHLMQAEPYGQTTVREVRYEGDEAVYELQGLVTFTGVEALMHAFDEIYDADQDGIYDPGCVVVDLSGVVRVVEVAASLLESGADRLRGHGLDVKIIDPEDQLARARPAGQ